MFWLSFFGFLFLSAGLFLADSGVVGLFFWLVLVRFWAASAGVWVLAVLGVVFLRFVACVSCFASCFLSFPFCGSFLGFVPCVSWSVSGCLVPCWCSVSLCVPACLVCACGPVGACVLGFPPSP